MAGEVDMLWNKVGIVAVALSVLLGCENQASENPMLEIHGRTMGTFYGVKVVGDFPGGKLLCSLRSMLY